MSAVEMTLEERVARLESVIGIGDEETAQRVEQAFARLRQAAAQLEEIAKDEATDDSTGDEATS